MSSVFKVILNRCRHWLTKLQAETAGSFQWLRAAGNPASWIITNKAGRAVLRAQANGASLKVYEAHSPGHAAFIAAVSERQPQHFPNVIGCRDSWVLAEWVAGSSPSPLPVREHVALLRKIHATPIAELPSPGFCYWNDYLVPRFMRAASLFEKKERAQEIVRIAGSTGFAPLVMHPDLTPANLLRTNSGVLVSVDNELLTIGTHPLLDVFNAIKPLRENARHDFLREWFSDDRPSEELIERTALAWIVRETGAAFLRGAFVECERYLSASVDDAKYLLRMPLELLAPK